MEVLSLAVSNPKEMTTFRHGSTIATNAILERKGANTGLVTTEGFRDVLEGARGERPDVFDLNWDPAPPLVPRYNRQTVPERIGFEGDVMTPLKESELKKIARIFRKRGIESVAICFINAFMNPKHEQRAKDMLSGLLPDAYICTSSEVFPEIREFERTSTTTVNAYLGPILDRYLTDLETRTKAWGFGGDVLIIHSGGGVMSTKLARTIPLPHVSFRPVQRRGRRCLYRSPRRTQQSHHIRYGRNQRRSFSRMEGRARSFSRASRSSSPYPSAFPCVDITTIGTGGGSIAWIDEGGALKNGPQSAGAYPGPACYGRGGEQPTNTDAQVVLGVIDPEQFLGGAMSLDAGQGTRGHRASHRTPDGDVG